MTSDDENDSSKSSGLCLNFVLLILNIVIIESGSLEQFQAIGLGDRWLFHNYMMWASVTILISTLVMLWLGCVTIISENDGCARLFQMVGFLCTIGIFVAVVIEYVYMGKLWHSDPEHTIFFYGPYWSEGVTNMNRPVLNQTVSSSFSGAYLVDPSNSVSSSNVTRTLQELGTASLAVMNASQNVTSLGNLRGSLRQLDLANKARGLLKYPLIIMRRLQETELASKWVYVMSDIVIRIYGFCLMILPVMLGLVACCGGTATLCGKWLN